VDRLRSYDITTGKITDMITFGVNEYSKGGLMAGFEASKKILN